MTRTSHSEIVLFPGLLVGLLAARGASVGPSGSTRNASTHRRPASFPDRGSRLGTLPGSQVITFRVVGAEDGALGSDGRRHDTFRASSSTTVASGGPVTVEIVNEDDVPHTFTLPHLGIDCMVPGGKSGQPGQAEPSS